MKSKGCISLVLSKCLKRKEKKKTERKEGISSTCTRALALAVSISPQTASASWLHMCAHSITVGTAGVEEAAAPKRLPLSVCSLLSALSMSIL